MTGVLRLGLSCVMTVALACCGQNNPPAGAGTGEQAVSAAPPDTRACTLVMGWDPWEPYQYQVDGAHVFGLDVDLLTAVVSNAGCTIDFRQESWSGLLELLKQGEVDVLGGATQTGERQEFARFTDAYRDEEFLVYVRADRLEELSPLTFREMLERGMKVGVVEAYLYGEPVSTFQDDSALGRQFEYSSMSETSISLLLDGEVDAIIEDKYVGASIIRRKNLADSVEPHPVRFARSNVHFMLSKASVDAELFERINSSLNRLLEGGQIQMILAQYQNE